MVKFKVFLGILFGIAIGIVVGMISPGELLTARSWDVKKVYNNLFLKAPIAEGFISTPFDLKLIYLKNTEGKLETYLFHDKSQTKMLPILEIEDTIQVGDLKHRFKGVSEDIRKRAEQGGSVLLDKASQILNSLENLLGD